MDMVVFSCVVIEVFVFDLGVGVVIVEVNEYVGEKEYNEGNWEEN